MTGEWLLELAAEGRSAFLRGVALGGLTMLSRTASHPHVVGKH